MNLYGCFFQYDGCLSEPHGLRLVNVDSKECTLLRGEIEIATIFNKRNRTRHDVGNIYDDAPISIDIDIVADYPIHRANERTIQKWLFNHTGYKKLYVFSNDHDQDSTYLNCRFINPERLEYAGGLFGYHCTMECDSDMAWQDNSFMNFDFADTTQDSNQLLTVAVDTDLDGYTFPRVTMRTGTIGGDIVVVNQSDSSSRLTSFLNIPPNTSVVVDGSYNYVSDSYYNHFKNRNFIRLLDGDNNISVLGDVASISFEWANRRYL